MKAKIQIEWNHEGFEEILTSDGARQVCEEKAQQIQAEANAGLKADDTPGFAVGGKVVKAYGSQRWMSFVHTTDAATMFAERDDQLLTKAVK